jgi:hypothetical protein
MLLRNESVQIAMMCQSSMERPRTHNLLKLLTTNSLLLRSCAWHPLCSEVLGWLSPGGPH